MCRPPWRDMPTILKNIREKLIAGVEKRLDADAPVGFLLSGGLDSSLVCSIAAKKLGKPIRTFAIGMDTDAIDLKYARQTAEYLGSEHHEIIINRDMVLNSLEEVIRLLGTWDITTIRASMGMYLLCKAIHEQTDVRVLLTGEISDELFGYKYTDYAPTADAFQQESQKRIRELYAEGKHHLAHYVRLKGGVGLGDALAHGLFHPVDEQPLPGAGEEHADLGLMRGEGAEHLPRKPLGALAHIAGGQAGQAFHHRVHHLVLHGVGQRIDILIMGVECGFIDAGTVAQLLDTDLFHRLFAAQLHKGLLDGALGLFNADIQKTHLFCIFVDFPTFFRFCG